MRKFVITVNGNEYEVDVEEVSQGETSAVRPEPKAKPAMKKAPVKKEAPKKEVKAAAGEEAVTAPMPGKILKLAVAEGASVNEGDVLVILEAMKMENEILAPRGGNVKAIGVAEGANVDTGELLVVIE